MSKGSGVIGPCVALVIACAASRASAEEPRPNPHVWIAPHALVDALGGVLFSSDLGVSVMLRVYEGLQVGAVYDHSGNIAAGPSGCNELEYCQETRSRYAGRIGYHWDLDSIVHPWVAFEVGAEHSTGQGWTDLSSARRPRDMEKSGAVFIPEAGFDVLGSVGRTKWGAGLFTGLPIRPVPGVQFGIRVVAAVF